MEKLKLPNPFESDRDITAYASRIGSNFSNFEHLVGPNDIERYIRIVASQGVSQLIYWISVYLETGDESATTEFSHGLVYMADMVKDSHQDIYKLFLEVYANVSKIGTDEQMNFAIVLKRLKDIQEKYQLNNEEYFNFAKENGISRENLLSKCIFYNLNSIIPRHNTPEHIKSLKERWLLSQENFEEFVKNSRELLNQVLEYNPKVKFNSNYFPLIQALEEANLVSS
jgi:hypothetical protein